MAIPVSGNSSEFTPAPAGAHQGVCVDILDHGFLETQWGKKRKVSIRWQIDELMPSGKRFMVQKRYTASLNERAVLRHDLESWRGKPFTQEELNEFDLEKLLGVNALLNVVHTVKDGKTWANVASITPLLRNMARLEPVGYVREVHKKAQEQAGGDHDPEDQRQYEDDPESVPF